MIILTKEECEAIHELIGQLSGNNPEYVFSWDEKDDISNPTTSACVKIYIEAGQSVPKGLKIDFSLKETLDLLTDEQRSDLLGNYCKYCGNKDPRCQCWNDE